MIPPEVARAYGWEAAEISTLPGGLINATHVVRERGVSVAVVQRLHPIFSGKVQEQSLSEYLEAHGYSGVYVTRMENGPRPARCR